MNERKAYAIRLTRALDLIEDARREISLPRLGGNPERQLSSAAAIVLGVRDALVDGATEGDK